MENWTITVTSPMGQTTAALRLDKQGPDLRGEMSGKGGTGPLEDGRIEGDQLSWTCRIQKPVPMTLKFKGVQRGDDLSGTVKFGMFGSGTFAAIPA